MSLMVVAAISLHKRPDMEDTKVCVDATENSELGIMFCNICGYFWQNLLSL